MILAAVASNSPSLLTLSIFADGVQLAGYVQPHQPSKSGREILRCQNFGSERKAGTLLPKLKKNVCGELDKALIMKHCLDQVIIMAGLSA